MKNDINVAARARDNFGQRKLLKNICDGVVRILKGNNIRKPVKIPEYSLHITDDEGNYADFQIKKIDKTAMYTSVDIQNILNALTDYICDEIQKGNEVFLNSFCTFRPLWRSDRWTRDMVTKEKITIPGHYVMAIEPGTRLKAAVKLYNAALADGTASDWRKREDNSVDDPELSVDFDDEDD